MKGKKNKKLMPADYIGSHKVIIKNHVVFRYMERAGVSFEEAQSTLERKFRNSKLSRLKPDGSEIRSEVAASMQKRLTFVAIKKGKTFIVVTCYLQGSRHNWWKNEGLVAAETSKLSADDEFNITKDIESHFQEVIG